MFCFVSVCNLPTRLIWVGRHTFSFCLISSKYSEANDNSLSCLSFSFSSPCQVCHKCVTSEKKISFFRVFYYPWPASIWKRIDVTSIFKIFNLKVTTNVSFFFLSSCEPAILFVLLLCIHLNKIWNDSPHVSQKTLDLKLSNSRSINLKAFKFCR